MVNHLELLKSDIPQEQSTTDGGLSDVLQAFAKSLGYRFVDESEYPEAAQYNWLGAMTYHTRTIFVSPEAEGLLRTEIIAHEIAHHFDFALTSVVYMHANNEETREQVAEAAAILFLLDYDVNLVEVGREYIKNNVPCDERFDNGGLDKAITMVYTAFSQEFEAFLKGAKDVPS